MELYDYLMTNLRIGQVQSGTNKDKFFVSSALRWLDPKTGKPSRGDKPLSYQVWSEDDQELVDVVRRHFPKTGKDSDGNDWNGLSTDIDPANFDPVSAARALRNYQDEDWLLLTGCSTILAPMNGLFCMKYSRAMNGHDKGKWVCGADGFVKVWSERLVLCRFYPDGSPRPGWSLTERMAKEMRNFHSLSEVIKSDPTLVDPKYLNPSESIIPSTSTAEEEVNENH